MENKPNIVKQRRDHFFVKCIPFIVFIIILFSVVFINQQLVRPTKNGLWARQVAKAAAFPVGRVGKEVFTYNSVGKELEQIHEMTLKLFQTPYSLEEELQLAYTKRIRDIVLKQGLSQYAITVSDDDVTRAFTQLFGDSPTSAEAIALVKQTMGLTPQELMRTTLRTYLEQQQLDKAVVSDAQLVRETRGLADAISARVSHDTTISFMKIAEEYDATQVKYISSSYLSRNEITGFYTPILTCEKDKVLPIIETEKAYLIFRCLDAIPADVSHEKRTHFNIEQLAILKPTFLQWLGRAYANSSISLYPKGIEWDALCQRAVLSGNSCAADTASDSQESEALKQLFSGSQPIFPPTDY